MHPDLDLQFLSHQAQMQPQLTSGSGVTEPFPSLPLDVARLIIESAASQDTSDALTTSRALSLVSSEVQRW